MRISRHRRGDCEQLLRGCLRFALGRDCNESVKGKDIKDESLNESDLGPGSVGISELQSEAVTTTKIATGAVGTTEIAGGAVTASKLSDDLRGRRQYYLTSSGTFDGATAPGACAAGYHMASFFELAYALLLSYDSALGFTTADMGSGPPSGIYGWVRTGNLANNSIGDPGTDNCLAYTTTAGSGTIVGLDSVWEKTNYVTPEIAPWGAIVIGCNITFRVWCIED